MRLFGKIDAIVDNRDRSALMRPNYFSLEIFPTGTDTPKFFCRTVSVIREKECKRLKLG